MVSVLDFGSSGPGSSLVGDVVLCSWTKHCTQGSYGSWKTRKVLEFYCDIFQDWKVVEMGYWSWKVLEFC